MRPSHDAPPSLDEIRAAVKSFAALPGPARFHRVCALLERAAPHDDDLLPL